MLEFPTILIESKKNKKVNLIILKSINEKSYMENNIYSRVTKRALVCDILPYEVPTNILDIREINHELLNKNAIIQVKTALNIMNSFGD